MTYAAPPQVDLARTHRPDVVLMDIRMPGTDGLAATATICEDPELAATRVLILTMFETDEYVAKALRVGASGFLTAPAPGALLAPAERLNDLTPREREVTALAAEGKSNDEIAEKLVLSVLTVRSHIQRALTKLGARDRAQLVVIAYQTGLVRPESSRF
ncbi:LuxR C-terminal-related transcriptional regulator [Streptomyces xiangluensis]|uniref:LuxR C-terminal-related transcriptional regulator n=1 Tax=Streptomyces xiangluensis TaxID=2665720 RepID=A0ABV8YJK3_9ACTN